MHESVDAVRAEHRLNESPPKRKGKCGQASKLKSFPRCLNESPSPKMNCAPKLGRIKY